MTRAVEGYRRGILGISELASWYGQSPEDLEQELTSPADPDGSHDEWVDDWGSDRPLFLVDGQDRPREHPA